MKLQSLAAENKLKIIAIHEAANKIYIRVIYLQFLHRYHNLQIII